MKNSKILFIIALGIAGAAQLSCSSSLTLNSTSAAALGGAVSEAADASADAMTNPSTFISGLGAFTQGKSSGFLAHVMRMADQGMGLRTRGKDAGPVLAEVRKMMNEQRLTSCSPTTSGTTTDSDGDHLPVNATYTINCTVSGFTITGTVTVADANDSSVASGFTITITDLKFSLGEVTIETDATITATGSGANWSLSYVYAMEAETSESSLDISFSLTFTYVATNAGAPFDAGTFTISGELSFSYGGDSASFTISSTGLTFDKDACTGSTPGFTGGSLSIAGGDHTVVVTYSSSCSSSVTFDGSSV